MAHTHKLRGAHARSLTGFLGHGDPVAAAAVALDVAAQRLVLLRRPRAPLHGRPVAARRPPHETTHAHTSRPRPPTRLVSSSSALLAREEENEERTRRRAGRRHEG
jgi:hypothetical protein